MCPVVGMGILCRQMGTEVFVSTQIDVLQSERDWCCGDRPIYAGNALQTVKYSVEGPRIATIRGSAFSAAALDANAQVPVENVNSEELEAAQVHTTAAHSC